MHAKSLQSCLTLCDPMDCSPPGSTVHGDSSGQNTGVGCCFLLQEISHPRDKTSSLAIPALQVDSLLLNQIPTKPVPSSASRGHRSVLGQNRLDLFAALLFPLLSLPCLPLTSSSADVTVSHSQFLWLVSAKAYLCSLSPLIVEMDISCSLEIRSCLLLTIQLASMEVEVRPFCTVKAPPKQSPVDVESSRPHPTPAHQNLHFNKISSDAVCISV